MGTHAPPPAQQPRRAEATSPPPANRDFRILLGHGGVELKDDAGNSNSSSALVAQQGVSNGATLVVVALHFTERQVLQRVYDSCNGGAWRQSAGWRGPAPSLLASLHGVTASSDGLHVVELKLSSNRLAGWFIVSHPPLCCVSWRGGPSPDCRGLRLIAEGRRSIDDRVGHRTDLFVHEHVLARRMPTEIGQLGRLKNSRRRLTGSRVETRLIAIGTRVYHSLVLMRRQYSDGAGAADGHAKPRSGAQPVNRYDPRVTMMHEMVNESTTD